MDYRDGDRAMYVSPYNNLDEVLHVSEDIQASLRLYWHDFDSMLQKASDLSHLVGKMFFRVGGELTAWFRLINKHHSTDKDWHISVDCIVVDLRNCTAVFLNAMNDIN